MISMDYTGTWNLPGADIKLPGRLILDNDEKKMSLELYSDKYPDGCPVINRDPERDKKYRSKDYSFGYASFHEVILGKTISLITLINCRWDGTTDIGGDLYLIKFRAQFAFFGAQVSKTADLAIRSARFIYPCLASWSEGFNSVNKLSRAEFESAKFIKVKGLESVPVNDNLSLVFVGQMEKGIVDVDTHHETRYQKYLLFEYKRRVGLQDLLDDAIVFRKLLEFSHGKPLAMMMIDIDVEPKGLIDYNKPFYDKRDLSIVSLKVRNFHLHEGKDVKRHMQHQRFMLISAWNMASDELGEAIKNWFANKKLSYVYDFYLDSNNWLQDSQLMISKVMYENKFVNLVQGLEGFYRQQWLEKDKNAERALDYDKKKADFEVRKKIVLDQFAKSAEIKSWLNSNLKFKTKPEKEIKLETMLRQLLTAFDRILKTIFGPNDVIDFFPKYASTIRNKISHGMIQKGLLGEELNIFFHTGQILMAICVLDSLEVKDIPDKIANYDTFERYIGDIRRTKIQFK